MAALIGLCTGWLRNESPEPSLQFNDDDDRFYSHDGRGQSSGQYCLTCMRTARYDTGSTFLIGFPVWALVHD